MTSHSKPPYATHEPCKLENRCTDANCLNHHKDTLNGRSPAAQRGFTDHSHVAQDTLGRSRDCRLQKLCKNASCTSFHSCTLDGLSPATERNRLIQPGAAGSRRVQDCKYREDCTNANCYGHHASTSDGKSPAAQPGWINRTRGCRIAECTHHRDDDPTPHYCRECGDKDSDHLTRDCPKKSKKTSSSYHCRECGDRDADHLPTDCPTRVEAANFKERRLTPKNEAWERPDGATNRNQAGRPAYAIDCEMVVVKAKRGEATTQSVVSVGVVDEQMEQILYARVKLSADCDVLDDSFVRVQGGLKPDWRKGIELSVAQNLLSEFSTSANGIIVGWEVQSDLRALGGVAASEQAKDDVRFPPYGKRTQLPLFGNYCNICELTDYYRTAKTNSKCQLSEAYNFTFARDLSAHNAGDDARMTMELYKHWCNLKCPDRISIHLKFYNITIRNFKPAQNRAHYLWTFLRVNRAGVKEKDEKDLYKVRFRREEHRQEYLGNVAARIQRHTDRTVKWQNPQPCRLGGQEIDCGAFVIYLEPAVDR